jgi:transcription termination factor Rho
MKTHIEVIAELGGITRIARRFGFPVGTVGQWVRRGISANAIAENERFRNELRRRGYDWMKDRAARKGRCG